MFEIILDHRELRHKVKFTDPLIHSMEKEDEILKYYKQGYLRNPCLLKDRQNYLIFNGNHRVLVAITNELSIKCTVLENVEDILKAQQDEGEDYRDIGNIVPLTFGNILKALRRSAKEWSTQDPDRYIF
jgi:hypothetical protein